MDARKVVGFAVGPIFSGVLGIVTLPVLAWTFSASDVGRLSMLQVLTAAGVVFFSFGLDQAYVRDFHDVDQKARPKLLIAAILPGLLFILSMALALVVAAPGVLSDLAFGIESASWSIGIIAAVILALVSRFFSLVLRMREQGFAFSFSQTLPKLLFLLVVCAAWAYGWTSFSVLLWANIATLMLVLIGFALYTKDAWLPGIAELPDWVAMRRMFRFGAPLVIGGVASWVVMAQAKLLLRHYSTMEELGLYSVAASLASAVGIATFVFTTIWVPTVYKWHSQGDAWPRVCEASKHATAASCLILVIAGLFSPLAALVLPEHYAVVPFLVPACTTLPLYYALSEATAVGLGLSRRTIYSMLASLVAAVAGLVVGSLLVADLGARGASLAAIAASATFVLCRTELASRAWQPIPRKGTYLWIVLLSVVSGAYVLYGHESSGGWLLAWTGLLMITIYYFRCSVRLGIGFSLRILRGWRIR